MKVNMGQPNDLLVDDLELLLREIDEFNTSIGNNRPLDIPQSLDNYLQFVAKSGNTVFPWPNVRTLFRTKMMNAIQQFQEPVCPNESFVLERFDLFRLAAPFTVQRLTELILQPTRHYRKKEKFLRGLEKTVLVVSTVEPYSVSNDDEKNGNDVSNTSASSCEPETEVVQFNRTFSLDRNDMNPTTVRPEVTPSSTDLIDPVAAAVDTISETLPLEGIDSTSVAPSVDIITPTTSLPSEGTALDANAADDLAVSMDSDDGQDGLSSSDQPSSIEETTTTSNIVIDSVTTTVSADGNLCPSGIISVSVPNPDADAKEAPAMIEPSESVVIDPSSETDITDSMDAEEAVLTTSVPISGASCETITEGVINDSVTTTETTATIESVETDTSVQSEDPVSDKVTSTEASSADVTPTEAAVVSSDGIILDPISDPTSVVVESGDGSAQMECESSTPAEIVNANLPDCAADVAITISQPATEAELAAAPATTVPEDVSSSLTSIQTSIPPIVEEENVSMDCQTESISETVENSSSEATSPETEALGEQS